jgi:RNA polymerase sigma-70 factor (ECF subfamily)
MNPNAAVSASGDLELRLEQHRRELTGYCYRMLGSSFEAEDAVQDTMLRAWRSIDRFEGRAALKSWLYRIATNVCLDMLNGRQRRARPIDIGAAGDPANPDMTTRAEVTWLEPIPDGRVLPQSSDPAELAVAQETLRLAFVAALQHLPARQRAVLILREALRWSAAEVAELLDTSVASVNSALQRARASLATSEPTPEDTSAKIEDDDQSALLERYVAAFEQYDIDALVALLHEDATLSMPPYELWLRGHADIAHWFTGIGCHCRGSRLIALTANGSPAFGQYRPSGPDGTHEPWALQVIEISDGKITGINSFLDTARMFPLFGLPASPP